MEIISWGSSLSNLISSFCIRCKLDMLLHFPSQFLLTKANDTNADWKIVNKSYVDSTLSKIGQTDQRRKKKRATSPGAEVIEHQQVTALLFLIWKTADVKIWSDNVHQIICAFHQRWCAIIMHHKDGGSSQLSSLHHIVEVVVAKKTLL